MCLYPHVNPRTFFNYTQLVYCGMISQSTENPLAYQSEGL